jgi:hypothetical protein
MRTDSFPDTAGGAGRFSQTPSAILRAARFLDTARKRIQRKRAGIFPDPLH